MSKKIVIDLTSLADNFTGFERFALNIAEEFLKQKPEERYVFIFKEEVYSKLKKYIDGNKNVESIILPRKNKLWFYQVTLFLCLKKIDADIFLFPAFPSPFFLRKNGIFNVIHDMCSWDCPKTMATKMVYYFRIMYWNAARVSQGIVTVSEFSKRRIHEILHVKLEKICVVYNGVAENLYETSEQEWKRIRKKYNLPEEYWMCLSTLEPRKNLQLLLKAYIRICEERECPYALVLAGRKGWKMGKILDEIPTVYKKKIIFTGYVEDNDLADIYRHSRLFIFPSLYEGFGIPPLEAMAVGCPVLSSDADAMKEVLSGEVEYFQNDNIDSLKEKLILCLEKEPGVEDRTRLIEYSKKFAYNRTILRLFEFLGF